MLDDARKSVSRGLALGEVAPDFELPILGDQEQVLRLSDVGGRPIVLIFGSYSCSPFRREISKLNRLYREFSSQVAFHLVYMREEHPDHERVEELDLKQPATLAERAENAAFCASEARIDMPITQSQTAKAAAQEALDDMASVDVPDAARDHWPSYTDLMRNSIEQLETDLETHAAMLNGQPVSSLQSKSAAQVANAKSLSTQVEAEILRLARMAGLSASETQEIGAEAQGAR